PPPRSPSYRLPRHLPSLPTRRSSDLERRLGQNGTAERERDLQADDRDDRDEGRLVRMLADQPELADAARAGRVHVRHVVGRDDIDRKSTRLNSSHVKISYAVFCLKKK